MDRRPQCPTEQCDQHLGERRGRVLHARRRRSVTASPGFGAARAGRRSRQASSAAPSTSMIDNAIAARLSISNGASVDQSRLRGQRLDGPGGDCPIQQRRHQRRRQSDRHATSRQHALRHDHRPRRFMRLVRASGDRLAPRNTTPNTFTKQATANAPIMRQRRHGERGCRQPLGIADPQRAKQTEVDQQLADEPIQRGQAANGRRARAGSRPPSTASLCARPPRASISRVWRA